jgi:hypothetical protein
MLAHLEDQPLLVVYKKTLRMKHFRALPYLERAERAPPRIPGAARAEKKHHGAY